jgi:hypothetical protein
MQSTIRVMLVVTGVKSPQIFAGESKGGPARKPGPDLDVVH